MQGHLSWDPKGERSGAGWKNSSRDRDSTCKVLWRKAHAPSTERRKISTARE